MSARSPAAPAPLRAGLLLAALRGLLPGMADDAHTEAGPGADRAGAGAPPLVDSGSCAFVHALARP